MNTADAIPSSIVVTFVVPFTVWFILKDLANAWCVHHNWNREEIRVRGRTLSVIFFCALFISEILQTVLVLTGTKNRPVQNFMQTPSSEWDAPVWLGLGLFPFNMSVVIGPLALKSIALVFKLQIAQEQLKLANLVTSGERALASQWYSKRRHWITQRNLLKTAAKWVLFCMVPPFIFHLSRRFVAGFLLLGLQGILLSVAFAVCGFKLRSSLMDFWRIKVEIFSYALAWSVCMVLFMIMALVVWVGNKTAHSSWKVFFTYLASITCTQLISYVTMKVDFSLAKKHLLGRHKLSRSPSVSGSDEGANGSNHLNPIGGSEGLESSHPSQSRAENLPEFMCRQKDNKFFQLLQSADFQETFKRHLASEFSLENLLFFIDVKDLYSSCSELFSSDGSVSSSELEDLIAKAEKIQDTYVNENSASAVNVSFENRGRAVEKMDQVRSDFRAVVSDSEPLNSQRLIKDISQIYLRSATEIFYVMQNDSFRRFKTTREFALIQSKQLTIMVVETHREVAL
eukprot:TRINITY_DN19493_c0_g1_i1.p1 TRINITY_DN19493_c0_g1~~TRINITY_DN19493_c0_g1_i1.p1  ORF type:complete len:513 (-),score=113.95 TRINITY_DN19493_c0_g1_i1:1169-2707(-)